MDPKLQKKLKDDADRLMRDHLTAIICEPGQAHLTMGPAIHLALNRIARDLARITVRALAKSQYAAQERKDLLKLMGH